MAQETQGWGSKERGSPRCASYLSCFVLICFVRVYL